MLRGLSGSHNLGSLSIVVITRATKGQFWIKNEMDIMRLTKLNCTVFFPRHANIHFIASELFWWHSIGWKSETCWQLFNRLLPNLDRFPSVQNTLWIIYFSSKRSSNTHARCRTNSILFLLWSHYFVIIFFLVIFIFLVLWLHHCWNCVEDCYYSRAAIFDMVSSVGWLFFGREKEKKKNLSRDEM